MRLRRSELSTPGSNERMMEKAAASSADLVFLDLEDAVAPNEKVGARGKIVSALRTHDWGRKTRAIRMNNVETEWAFEDVIHIVEEAGEVLDIIIIPKVKSAEDVRWVDTLLTQIERKHRWERRIGLEVLIEEVEAMVNVEAIARSTPRLEALIFGPGDYSASQGVRVEAVGGISKDYPGDVWHYARNKVVIAAKAAGIEAVDGPFADFKDEEGYRRECTRAAVLGFTGKWAIHPSQVGIANEVFSPTEKQVERARKMIAAYEEAERQGLGAVAVDGVMVDAASARLMRNVTTKADAIGM
ncbi:MAG: CoA ester lyase [Dehalococcoidia bacterium]|nr:CoA ester lyase [Dehalococcoidia bacterium]NUQ54930.1 CoA ester lyase [Dehalococcoidia bacterium]RIL02642.1 MAG: CoA ester lyase [bacterium]